MYQDTTDNPKLKHVQPDLDLFFLSILYVGIRYLILLQYDVLFMLLCRESVQAIGSGTTLAAHCAKVKYSK